MTNSTLLIRNEVLQYGMNHDEELHGVLYLKNPFKSGTIEVYGCTINGDILGVDSDGEEITITYGQLGIDNFFRFFHDLHKKYCS